MMGRTQPDQLSGVLGAYGQTRVLVATARPQPTLSKSALTAAAGKRSTAAADDVQILVPGARIGS